MRPFWKKMLSCAMAFVCLTGAAAGLTGCHGSKEKAAFEVPESFDTTKQYEITFWAKNDTNIRQTDIYKKTIADFETLYPNITVNLNAVGNQIICRIVRHQARPEIGVPALNDL